MRSKDESKKRRSIKVNRNGHKTYVIGTRRKEKYKKLDINLNPFLQVINQSDIIMSFANRGHQEELQVGYRTSKNMKIHQ